MKNIYTEYQAETITLHSMSLTMNIKCSVLSEYFYKCDENELNSALKNEIDIDKIKIINEQLEKLKNPEYCKEL